MLAPELFLSGYPPEDLVLKPAFQEACRTACEALARDTADGGPAVLVGLPWVEDGALYNAAALLNGGRIEAVRFKVDLPNYGVFDEKRVFRPGPDPGPLTFKGVRLGVPICEDIWGPDPVECIAETGGEILLVPNASPYERDKLAVRQAIAVARVVESGLPLIYLNAVGGQDELVFEGGSFALNADRTLAAQLPGFRETVAKTVWERSAAGWRLRRGSARDARCRATRAITPPACWACAITSSATASPAWCWACPAASIRRCARRWRSTRWGASRVHAVMLPYKYTSRGLAARRGSLRPRAGHSLRHRADRRAGRGDGARAGADVRRPAARHYRGEHPEPHARADPDVDLQQVRRDGGHDRQQVGDVGRLRHALRRHERRLQPDQGPLQDGGVPALRLAQPLEAGRARLGRTASSSRRHHRASRPSAELRENQKDEDSLPPYPVLDGILNGLVEKEMRVADIVALGFDLDTVQARRAAALSRRIQAAAIGAGREGRPEEFRPRPPLSHRQPLPRRGRCRPRARPDDRADGPGRRRRAVRGVGLTPHEQKLLSSIPRECGLATASIDASSTPRKDGCWSHGSAHLEETWKC